MGKNSREYSRKWRQKRYEQGKCWICGADLTDKRHRICEDCREYERKRAEILHQERRDRGVCIYCGINKPLPNSDNCGCKYEKQKAIQASRLARGLCIECGKNPIDFSRGKTRCTHCLDKHKVYAKEERERRKSLNVTGR